MSHASKIYDIWCCLQKFGFFVQWHVNLYGLVNSKAILIEEQQWYYLTYDWRDKVVHAFSKNISLKMNVIVRLDFEATIQNFDH